MLTAETIRRLSWEGPRDVTYKGTINQKDQGSRKNWGMTAFSKELAVVSRVEQTGLTGRSFQEEGD